MVTKNELKNLGQRLVSFPFYAYLITLFPILFLFSHNQDQLLLAELYLPILLVILVVSVCLLAGKFLYRSWYKAALALLTIIIIIFSFSSISLRALCKNLIDISLKDTKQTKVFSFDI